MCSNLGSATIHRPQSDPGYGLALIEIKKHMKKTYYLLAVVALTLACIAPSIARADDNGGDGQGQDMPDNMPRQNIAVPLPPGMNLPPNANQDQGSEGENGRPSNVENNRSYRNTMIEDRYGLNAQGTSSGEDNQAPEQFRNNGQDQQNEIENRNQNGPDMENAGENMSEQASTSEDRPRFGPNGLMMGGEGEQNGNPEGENFTPRPAMWWQASTSPFRAAEREHEGSSTRPFFPANLASSSAAIEARNHGQEVRLETFAFLQNRLVDQLTRALNNLEQIRGRIANRIQLEQQSGLDMSAATNLLAQADNTLSGASTAIKNLAAYVPPSVATSTDLTASTTIDLNAPRQVSDAAIATIENARQALNAVVNAIAQALGADLSVPQTNITATSTATTTSSSTTP